MKLYRIFCDKCGWESATPVEEVAAKQFIKDIKFCLDCKKKEIISKFRTEEVIVTSRSHRKG